MGSNRESVPSKKMLDNYEEQFNTLKIISLKAINEFEELQKKCEDNFAKYLEERENYLRTKKELETLQEVSGEVLGEYDNLHIKYTIEQECRDKAEDYAKQQVKENKMLKRQSAILLNTLVQKAVDFDLDELSGEVDDLSSTEDQGLNDQAIEWKQQVESLKIKNEELSQNLKCVEEKLCEEKSEHNKTKVELKNNMANFKQLNRVSHLALDDFSDLQKKYEMEIEFREQAEKIAAEASHEHEAFAKQRELVSNDLTGDEKLQKALDEIGKLTKKLLEQRTEFDGKVKELEEELASSNDARKLKSLEDKINTFAQGVETLEDRLTQAQARATQAEEKAKKLEEELKKAKVSNTVPSAPPLPPPPPPPPPAPTQLFKRFVGMVAFSGKRSLKRNKTVIKEDPRIKAMSEMMERIKTGKVSLKPIQRQVTMPERSETEDGRAIENLRKTLKTLRQSPSKTSIKESENEKETAHTFGIQLRKTGDRNGRFSSESDDSPNKIQSVTLRKARSHSAGELLDEEPTMDKDLVKHLKRQKAAAERDENSEESPEKNSPVKDKQRKNSSS